MVDLEELEMTDLGESDGFGFESLNGEGGEYEAAFDYEGGEFNFEDFEDFSNSRPWARRTRTWRPTRSSAIW